MTAMDDKLCNMRNVHLVIADLFLPHQATADAGLHLPALEKMLARGAWRSAGVSSLEHHLCELFAVTIRQDAPIAPVSAAFDGLEEGSWLRADPVHLRLQRDQLVLLPAEADMEDAGLLSAALNAHFAGQGIAFFAPHPQRWYLRLDRVPDIETVPLSQAAGRNVRDLLPRGREAGHWHRLFNEIQMLLFAHPLNAAREARGELPINSLWLWGCGTNVAPQKNYEQVSSDDDLAAMFAVAAGIPFSAWAAVWHGEQNRQLLVFTGLRRALKNGDLHAWHTALQQFETSHAEPLWHALRAGKIAQLRVDIIGRGTVLLTRADAWAFWRRRLPLAHYSLSGE